MKTFLPSADSTQNEKLTLPSVISLARSCGSSSRLATRAASLLPVSYTHLTLPTTPYV